MVGQNINASAGGQLEQPSEVYNSTTAKPLSPAFIWFDAFERIKAVNPAAIATKATRLSILIDFMTYDIIVNYDFMG